MWIGKLTPHLLWLFFFFGGLISVYSVYLFVICAKNWKYNLFFCRYLGNSVQICIKFGSNVASRAPRVVYNCLISNILLKRFVFFVFTSWFEVLFKYTMLTFCAYLLEWSKNEWWYYRAKDTITIATRRDNVLVRTVCCVMLEHNQQAWRIPSFIYYHGFIPVFFLSLMYVETKSFHPLLTQPNAHTDGMFHHQW